MKKFLIVLALLFSFSTPALAAGSCDDISVQGFPESVVIDLKKKCVELAKPVTPAIDIDSMGEYAELGKKYGVALSEVAKSIGTTVNELAQTPVGKFMLVMVAYRVMGDGIIGILGGVIWFTTMLPIWMYLFNRMVFRNRKTKTYQDINTGKDVVEVTPIDFTEQAGVVALWFLFTLLLICIAGFIMIFA
jgi:hypothetical protein